MNIFNALGEPTRLSIIELLARGGQLSASDISNKFSSSKAAISQHLRILREAHLVKVEKHAQKRIYTINPEGLVEVEEWAKKIYELWDQRFDTIDKLLEEEKKRL